ncbi:MAG: hypothetical protein WCH57_00910 [Verrucomicrobiota bacterium]
MNYKSLVFAWMLFPLLAQAGDYEITVNRKKEAFSQSHEGRIQKSSQNWIGEVNVTNHGFKVSPELELRYIIFVKRQDLGKTAASAEHVEKIKGTFKIPSLKGGAMAANTTPEVKLRQGKLDSRCFFTNGGIEKSEDTVLGVWARLYQGTTQVEEYVSPTTLKGKQKWD